MYTIKETAKKLSINQNLLRFYERKELISPVRENNGYRYYSENDIGRIQLILMYRKMGFSLEAIKELIEESNQRSVIDLFVTQYNFLNNHIHALTEIRETLGVSIESLLEKENITPEILCRMQESSSNLSDVSEWKDVWNFDSWATSYDKDIRKYTSGLNFYKNYDDVIRFTAQKVNEKSGKVVEIGIGTGNLMKEIIAGNNVTDMLGIDQSVQMLTLAKRKLPELKLLVGSFMKLPLPSNSYHIVVTSYAFHHCNDTEKLVALKEMDRVLDSHGRIIITDLMFENQSVRETFAKKCSEEELRDLEDEYFGNVDEIEKIVMELGYHCSHFQINELIWLIEAEK
ncbi:MAG TPA: MerR family transcriptional regulator [Lachnospiraceae bacterium]|nr:MerR family transcriptional regulator [Lachnospiraceae bacterium]